MRVKIIKGKYSGEFGEIVCKGSKTVDVRLDIDRERRIIKYKDEIVYTNAEFEPLNKIQSNLFDKNINYGMIQYIIKLKEVEPTEENILNEIDKLYKELNECIYNNKILNYKFSIPTYWLKKYVNKFIDKHPKETYSSLSKAMCRQGSFLARLLANDTCSCNQLNEVVSKLNTYEERYYD